MKYNLISLVGRRATIAVAVVEHNPLGLPQEVLRLVTLAAPIPPLLARLFRRECHA
jgi:hypothetical protein